MGSGINGITFKAGLFILFLYFFFTLTCGESSDCPQDYLLSGITHTCNVKVTEAWNGCLFAHASVPPGDSVVPRLKDNLSICSSTVFR